MATTKKHTKKTGDSSKKGRVSNGDFINQRAAGTNMTTIFKFKLQFQTILLGTMTFVVIMALNDVLEIDQLQVSSFLTSRLFHFYEGFTNATVLLK